MRRSIYLIIELNESRQGNKGIPKDRFARYGTLTSHHKPTTSRENM
jgi:hypothetical protein